MNHDEYSGIKDKNYRDLFDKLSVMCVFLLPKRFMLAAGHNETYVKCL